VNCTTSYIELRMGARRERGRRPAAAQHTAANITASFMMRRQLFAWRHAAAKKAKAL
jgi:hypothetical protein